MRFFLLFLLLLAAFAGQAQQQSHSPADYAVARVKATRYDSLLIEYRDLKRVAIALKQHGDTLANDLETSNAGNRQLRRALYNEIDVTQAFERAERKRKAQEAKRRAK